MLHNRQKTMKWQVYCLGPKFCTDISGLRNINTNNVGDPLTVPLAPPGGRYSPSQNFYLSNTNDLSKVII